LVHWTFSNTNYNPQSGDASVTITPINATCTVTGYSGPYTGTPHGASGSCTGIGGATLSGLWVATTTHTNVPGGLVHWTFSNTNYNPQSGDAPVTINKVNPNCTVTPYSVVYDTLPHVATGSCLGVLGETLSGLNLNGTTHTVQGTYNDTWTFTDVTGNYYNKGPVPIIDVITSRKALVRYIGQTWFVTSGTSATTAQVALTASMQDPTGLALAGATVDFIDQSTNKVLAAGVKVTPVAGSPGTGTANTIVTLSTGQYGAESYLILVKASFNYDNAYQPTADKTATVVVCKPAAANETTGGGTIAKLAAAGTYGVNTSGDATFSLGMKYNKSGTNPQGKISLELPQLDGSVIYVYSNSVTSFSVTGTGNKKATIYTKASIVRVLNGTITTIDGGATLRMDVADNATDPDQVGFTVLSSKTSELFYSNNWVLDASKTWKTGTQTLTTGTVKIN
jgi:hypothetical protein